MANTNDTLLEGYLVTPTPVQSNNGYSKVQGSSHTVSHANSLRASQDSPTNTILEYFRSAREEVMLRVKYRDNWLIIQLLSQVVLFALAQGVEIAGVRASGANPIFLFLSIPISLLLASLYHIEDSIIGYIGNYISAIPEAEAEISTRKTVIRNWDASEQFKLYGSRALPIRLIAQTVAFLLIPICLSGIRMSSVKTWGLFQWVELLVNALFAIVVSAILIRGFLLRRSINGESVSGIIEELSTSKRHSTRSTPRY